MIIEGYAEIDEIHRPGKDSIMIAVTRRQILSEMLLYYEAQSRMVSKNLANREPMDGFEPVFDGYQLRCRVIRELMRDLEGGEKLEDKETRAPAQWQKDALKDPESALVMDIKRRG